MLILDLTLPTPEENLACDEALLNACDAGEGPEVLRFWESPIPFVVLGYANKSALEVEVDACRLDGVPILRRSSGGGTVLQGPGCLNFALILRIPPEGPLRTISGTNDFITAAHEHALRACLGAKCMRRGLSDLAMDTLKFSGNAQRRKRNAVLFHGTFLLDFDIPLIGRTLAMPSRQPDYRQNRPHRDFLVNVGQQSDRFKNALTAYWGAAERLAQIPEKEIARLVREQFSTPEWNLKF
jgi:lipoate-protein ligase A